jgi:outer membrane protein assembly factor BamB
LPEPVGDAGTLAFVTRSPGLASVVALSSHGLYAVDVASGRVLWQSQGTESFDTASDAGAPQFADTNVYVYDQTGAWWAVDLPTGRTRWRYPVVAGFEQGAEPVWLAVPGGVVVSAGGTVTMLPAHG